MIKNKFIFLIRAYNEATRIVSVIEGIFAAGYDQILVVDDGSSDDTDILLARAFGDRIHFVRHVVNRGPGAALETGFEYIRRMAYKNPWEYLVTFDADGQMDIKDMGKFIAALETDHELDLVIGSRFITKTDTNVPFFRRLILWGGKIFTSMISGIRLTDAHNGYRMLRISTLDRIHLTMDGMEYASEFIDQVSTYHLRYREVPVNIHYDEYTLAKGQRMGGAWRVMTRMIFKKFF